MTPDAPERQRLWPAYLTVASFATLPYAELVASNAGGLLEFDRIAVWWLTSLLAVIGVVAVSNVAGGVKAARRSAAALSPLLLLFFRYGSLIELLETRGVDPSRHLTIWLALAGLVAILMVIFSRVAAAQVFLAILGPALLVVPLAQYAMSGGPAAVNDDPVSFRTTETVARPNIWLLLTDGYASPDTVEQVTEVDMAPFVGSLQARGLVVLPQARSNYPQTILSMPSLFEMQYVVEEGEGAAAGYPYEFRISGDNATVRTLQGMGYEYVQSPSALWTGSACMGFEDLCVDGDLSITETQLALYRSTPLVYFFQKNFRRAEVAAWSDPASRVQEVLASEPEAPYFVYAHFMSPHPPFWRSADCTIQQEASINQAATQHSGSEYGEMILCLNRQLISAVDLILDHDPDAVILIQSDHGSAVNFDLASVAEYPEERYAIFSSLRLPEECAPTLPKDLDTVNVFRVLFACLRGEDASLLDYRRYMVGYNSFDVRLIEGSESTN